jgi:hypothetical protein
MIEDLTIILQGRCEDEPLKMWFENYSNHNVILSIWNDYTIPFDIPSNWKVIKRDIPKRYAEFQNVDLQITSTLNGLLYVDTKYTLKVRADEYYSNIETIYKKMKLDENKILCGSFVFRRLDGLYPYHISDHIICGTTDNIKLMFESAYENLINDLKFNNTPESILGFAFVAKKENFDMNNMSLYIGDMYKYYMKKWYHIINVNELYPFILTKKTNTSREYIKEIYDHCGCIYDINTI